MRCNTRCLLLGSPAACQLLKRSDAHRLKGIWCWYSQLLKAPQLKPPVFLAALLSELLLVPPVGLSFFRNPAADTTWLLLLHSGPLTGKAVHICQAVQGYSPIHGLEDPDCLLFNRVLKQQLLSNMKLWSYTAHTSEHHVLFVRICLPNRSHNQLWAQCSRNGTPA